jgi:vibriolysin
MDFATSPVAQHPAVVVNGRRGEFALVGVGAFVDWESYGLAGNLLWKLQPRPDLAGVEVGSKDHSIYSPATVTGYAVGLKLVQGPVPSGTRILRFPLQ